MYKVKFTPRGQKDLQKLPRDLHVRIIKRIQFFSSQIDPLYFSKPLIELPPNTHRFRVGNYRIAFYVSSGTIYIDRIKHRKEVYRG